MANLNIGASLATVNTLASLPVTKGTIYATLSAPTNLSLAAAMYQGQKLNVAINPTAFINQPIPNTGNWYSTFGEMLTLISGVKTVITITCIGDGKYVVSGNNDAGKKSNGYEYVDLGLPSGLMWATCNVGASQPHEYGKYFQWGATEGYYSGTTAAAHSTWSTCPWSSATPTMTQLDAAHDAARANMGGEWRMPTSADTLELYSSTTCTYVTLSGIYGMRFTSNNNSNSIFIPAAGGYDSGYNDSLNSASGGRIWTSSLGANSDGDAGYQFNYHSGNYCVIVQVWRYVSTPVRGIIRP